MTEQDPIATPNHRIVGQYELDLDDPRSRVYPGPLTPSTSPLRLLATELTTRVSESAVPVSGPDTAGQILIDLIGRKDREHFVVLHLNSQHRVLAAETVSIGVLNSTLVHPREVFKAAILANTHSIICGHNHPSGCLEPSGDDISAHARLKSAGSILGIEVLDALVVTDTDYRSLRRG